MVTVLKVSAACSDFFPDNLILSLFFFPFQNTNLSFVGWNYSKGCVFMNFVSFSLLWWIAKLKELIFLYQSMICMKRDVTENALKNGHAWECLIIHNLFLINRVCLIHQRKVRYNTLFWFWNAYLLLSFSQNYSFEILIPDEQRLQQAIFIFVKSIYPCICNEFEQIKCIKYRIN